MKAGAWEKTEGDDQPIIVSPFAKEVLKMLLVLRLDAAPPHFFVREPRLFELETDPRYWALILKCLNLCRCFFIGRLQKLCSSEPGTKSWSRLAPQMDHICGKSI